MCRRGRRPRRLSTEPGPAKCTAIPIRSSAPLEHELAEAVGRIADGCVASFGSSDCDCPGHLFFFADNPLERQPFIDLLQRFRIDRLEEAIGAGRQHVIG